MSTPGDSDNDKIKWNMQAQRAIDVQLERGRVGSARESGDGVVWHGNEVEWRPVQKLHQQQRNRKNELISLAIFLLSAKHSSDRQILGNTI